MTSEDYQGRRIKVVSFDDATSGEYIIEFVDPAVSSTDSVIAVFTRGAGWSDARASISPRVDDVSAEFLAWALGIARHMMEGDTN